MTAAGPDLATARSATSSTVVVTRLAAAEPLLFVLSGSALLAWARATLTSVPVAGAVTVTEYVSAPPLASVATAGQVTTPAASTPPLSAETKVTPAGSVSTTATLLAGLGPWFVVTMVYVMEPSAVTAAGPDLATARSATSSTVVVTRLAAAEPLLFVLSGSALLASARATLISVPVAGAVTVTLYVSEAPLASEAAAGQVTTPPASTPPLSAETKVTPAGSVSATATLLAGLGPWFVVTMG